MDLSRPVAVDVLPESINEGEDFPSLDSVFRRRRIGSAGANMVDLELVIFHRLDHIDKQLGDLGGIQGVQAQAMMADAGRVAAHAKEFDTELNPAADFQLDLQHARGAGLERERTRAAVVHSIGACIVDTAVDRDRVLAGILHVHGDKAAG